MSKDFDRYRMTAKCLLLRINPLVPSLLSDSFESWANPRPLTEEVKEFGWHSLPTVRKLVDDIADQLKCTPEDEIHWPDGTPVMIAGGKVAPAGSEGCDDYATIADVLRDWRRLWELEIATSRILMDAIDEIIRLQKMVDNSLGIGSHSNAVAIMLGERVYKQSAPGHVYNPDWQVER